MIKNKSINFHKFLRILYDLYIIFHIFLCNLPKNNTDILCSFFESDLKNKGKMHKYITYYFCALIPLNYLRQCDNIYVSV